MEHHELKVLINIYCDSRSLWQSRFSARRSSKPSNLTWPQILLNKNSWLSLIICIARRSALARDIFIPLASRSSEFREDAQFRSFVLSSFCVERVEEFCRSVAVWKLCTRAINKSNMSEPHRLKSHCENLLMAPLWSPDCFNDAEIAFNYQQKNSPHDGALDSLFLFFVFVFHGQKVPSLLYIWALFRHEQMPAKAVCAHMRGFGSISFLVYFLVFHETINFTSNLFWFKAYLFFIAHN